MLDDRSIPTRLHCYVDNGCSFSLCRKNADMGSVQPPALPCTLSHVREAPADLSNNMPTMHELFMMMNSQKRGQNSPLPPPLAPALAKIRSFVSTLIPYNSVIRTIYRAYGVLHCDRPNLQAYPMSKGVQQLLPQPTEPKSARCYKSHSTKN